MLSRKFGTRPMEPNAYNEERPAVDPVKLASEVSTLQDENKRLKALVSLLAVCQIEAFDCQYTYQ